MSEKTKNNYVRWSAKDIAKLISLNGVNPENYSHKNLNIENIAEQMGRSVTACISVYYRYIENGSYKILNREVIPEQPVKEESTDLKIQAAVNLLKANGYKILKLVTEYQEI
jgi:hypothetical protein